jgi:hypothetical protein
MEVTTKLRVARPTDDLEQTARFYKEGLGRRQRIIWSSSTCRMSDSGTTRWIDSGGPVMSRSPRSIRTGIESD